MSKGKAKEFKNIESYFPDEFNKDDTNVSVKDKNDLDVISLAKTSQKIQNKSTEVSETYDRKKYEDKGAMKRHKDKVYDKDGTATDKYTHEKIYRNHNEAKEKYGDEASKHQGETDHTVSLHEAYGKGRNMSYITDEDVKKQRTENTTTKK